MARILAWAGISGSGSARMERKKGVRLTGSTPAWFPCSGGRAGIRGKGGEVEERTVAEEVAEVPADLRLGVLDEDGAGGDLFLLQRRTGPEQRGRGRGGGRGWSDGVGGAGLDAEAGEGAGAAAAAAALHPPVPLPPPHTPQAPQPAPRVATAQIICPIEQMHTQYMCTQ